MMYVPMQPEIVEGPGLEPITTSDGSIYLPNWNGDHLLDAGPEGAEMFNLNRSSFNWLTFIELTGCKKDTIVFSQQMNINGIFLIYF